MIVNAGVTGDYVDNQSGGTINAVQAELAGFGGNTMALAVNNGGFINATGIEERKDGRIYLTGSGAGAQISVGRQMIARDHSHNDPFGGEIYIRSEGDVEIVENADIKALGSSAQIELTGKKGVRVMNGSLHPGGGTLRINTDTMTIGSAEDSESDISDERLASLTENGDIEITASEAIYVNEDVYYGSGYDLSLLSAGDIHFNASLQNNSYSGILNLMAGWDGSSAIYDINMNRYGNNNGSIFIGDGSQTDGVAVGAGTRAGGTYVYAHNLTLNGGSGEGSYALLGYHLEPSENVVNSYIEGHINVEVKGDVTLQAGSSSGLGSFAQIGHFSTSDDENQEIRANIDITSSGTGSQLTLTGGDRGAVSDAHIGHEAREADNPIRGDITIRGFDSVALTSGDKLGEDEDSYAAYTQIGHGGGGTANNIYGDILLEDIGTLSLESGNMPFAYALLGHGSGKAGNAFSDDSLSGNITINTSGDITTTSGTDDLANFVWIGHASTELLAGSDPEAPLVTGELSITANGWNSGASDITVMDGDIEEILISGLDAGNVTLSLTGTHLQISGDDINYSADSMLNLYSTRNIFVNTSLQNHFHYSTYNSARWFGIELRAGGYGLDDIYEANEASIIIGDGQQDRGIAIGSRSGTTYLYGKDITLNASTTHDDGYAQVGYRLFDGEDNYDPNENPTPDLNGGLDIWAAGTLRVNGSTRTGSHAQIGHTAIDQNDSTSATIEVDSYLEVEAHRLELRGANQSSLARIGHDVVGDGASINSHISVGHPYLYDLDYSDASVDTENAHIGHKMEQGTIIRGGINVWADKGLTSIKDSYIGHQGDIDTLRGGIYINADAVTISHSEIGHQGDANALRHINIWSDNTMSIDQSVIGHQTENAIGGVSLLAGESLDLTSTTVGHSATNNAGDIQGDESDKGIFIQTFGDLTTDDNTRIGHQYEDQALVYDPGDIGIQVSRWNYDEGLAASELDLPVLEFGLAEMDTSIWLTDSGFTLQDSFSYAGNQNLMIHSDTGDITLNAGMNNSGTGNIVLSGMNFFNNAGATPLQTAGDWQVYSERPDEGSNNLAITNRDYLMYGNSLEVDSGDKGIVHSPNNDLPDGSGLIYSVTPVITGINADDKTITYGDDVGSLTASGEATVDGDVVDGAEFGLITDGLALDESIPTSAAGYIEAGSYEGQILRSDSFSGFSNIHGIDQDLTQVDYNGGDLTVTPASLVIRVNDDEQEAGTAYEGGNGVVYEGLVTGEDETSLAGSLIYGGNAQGATQAGTYTISASGQSSNNYRILYEDGELELTDTTPAILPTNDTSTAQSLDISLDTGSGGEGTLSVAARTQLWWSHRI